MLYGGINLYSTVRLYFSLQWKIYLLCRCLHNADVVLYPGTPQWTQRKLEFVKILLSIITREINFYLTPTFNKYPLCIFIYFSLILKQRVRNNINCYGVLISGLTYYKQNDCHHNNMSYTISDNRLKLALERVITLTIIIIDCKL